MAEVRNNPQQQQTATKEQARSIEPYRKKSDLTRPGWGNSPFAFMRRFFGDMDRFFDEFGLESPELGSPRFGEGIGQQTLWAPKVDVFERAGHLVVHADLPGMKQDDVKVNVEPGLLTISGERSHSHEHDKDGIYQCERSYGAFRRGIALPDGVAPESVQAAFDNGVLEVTMPMPKQQQPQGRQIPIGTKPAGVKH